MHGDSGSGQPGYGTYPGEPGETAGDGTGGYGTGGYGTGGYGTGGYGTGGYGPPRMPRRRAGLLTHIVVAVLAAALGAGVMLALYHPASSNSAAPLPGSSAVPAPAASPAGGGS